HWAASSAPAPLGRPARPSRLAQSVQQKLPALTNLLVLSRARGRSEQGWRWPPGDGPTGAAAVAVVADSIFAFAIGRCRAVGSPSMRRASPEAGGWASRVSRAP